MDKEKLNIQKEIEDYFVESAGYGRDKVKNFMNIVNKALFRKSEHIAELEKENEELKTKTQWHNMRENPNDLPKCEEDKQIIFYVEERYEKIQKYITHYCLGFYKKAFLNEEVKVFVEKSKGYENEHFPTTVIAWCEIPTFKEIDK